jgi:hypothetical protein
MMRMLLIAVSQNTDLPASPEIFDAKCGILHVNSMPAYAVLFLTAVPFFLKCRHRDPLRHNLSGCFAFQTGFGYAVHNNFYAFHPIYVQ